MRNIVYCLRRHNCYAFHLFGCTGENREEMMIRFQVSLKRQLNIRRRETIEWQRKTSLKIINETPSSESKCICSTSHTFWHPFISHSPLPLSLRIRWCTMCRTSWANKENLSTATTNKYIAISTSCLTFVFIWNTMCAVSFFLVFFLSSSFFIFIFIASYCIVYSTLAAIVLFTRLHCLVVRWMRMVWVSVAWSINK